MIPLSELKVGVLATVQSMDVEKTVNQRLMAFGLVPGTNVRIGHIAPLGDPISVHFGAQSVMLRRRDAKNVIVNPIEESK
ncbi:MAG: ferrous iron transport protein A [Opitutales bacterium]|nr:ferrous iron transport protein A [Opitutales bacterium]